jgi:hypothetical protein
MQPLLRLVCTGLFVICSAEPAVAQIADDDWTRGTTVGGAAGSASSSSHSGPLLGGTIGWEVTPRFTLEGAASWLDRGQGADGFLAALKARVGVRHEGTSPFVEGGFGLYRMTTDGSGEMPEFYRRRMVAGSTATTSQAFTDPVFLAGGGLNFFLRRHLALQPALEALFVTRGGHMHTIGAFSLRLVYHFEDRPVTPSRRR